jgi:hypothetical protein
MKRRKIIDTKELMEDGYYKEIGTLFTSIELQVEGKGEILCKLWKRMVWLLKGLKTWLNMPHIIINLICICSWKSFSVRS